MSLIDVVKSRPASLAVAVVGGSVLLGACRPAPPPVVSHQTPATVAALGRLEPESKIIDVGATPGVRIGRFEDGVKEGATVKEGDVLAYLDSYAEAAAARAQAGSQLAEAEQQRRAERESGQAAVDNASLGIQRSESTMQLRIDAHEAEVRRSEAELAKMRGDLSRAEKLRAADAILPGQYDAAVLAVKTAEEVLARNKATLAELKEDREIRLRESRDGLRSAEAGRIRGELSARVESLTQAVKLADARLELRRIRAPQSGEIVQILVRPGEVVRNDPILKMGNTEVMAAVAEVYETDVRFVQVGQKATVTSTAFPDRITGRVERISALIHKSDVLGLDPTAAADSRVVEVRVRLDASTTASRYNRHQVQVVIETADHTSAGR